jgi:hypothetical protein
MSIKHPINKIDGVEDAEDSSTHNKELAEDVLIDSPPAAGVEGFVENIARPRELGYSYVTKRYGSTRCRLLGSPLALDAQRTGSGFCCRELSGGGNRARKESVMLPRHYAQLGLVYFVFRYRSVTLHDIHRNLSFALSQPIIRRYLDHGG